MKIPHLLTSVIALSSLALQGCALFQQPKCDCEKLLAEQCPVTPHDSADNTTLVARPYDATKASTLKAIVPGGEVEPSSALEVSGNVAQNDDIEDESYDEEMIDDEIDNGDQNSLPDGITASQMDQIMPSNSMRQRIDIPDSARNTIQIPVLTALKPEDSAWRSDIAAHVRDLDTSKETALRAITAEFLSHYGRKSTAVVTPGQSIEIYSDGRHSMKRPIGLNYRLPSLAALWPYPMYAAQLVEDDPLEIVVIGLDKESDSDAVKMMVFKVFGDKIGRIFETEIGLVSEDKVIRTAQIEFVSGKNDIGIRRTPIDSSGNVDMSNSVIYDWNHWEGSYDINKPPERSLGTPSWMKDTPPSS